MVVHSVASEGDAAGLVAGNIRSEGARGAVPHAAGERPGVRGESGGRGAVARLNDFVAEKARGVILRKHVRKYLDVRDPPDEPRLWAGGRAAGVGSVHDIARADARLALLRARGGLALAQAALLVPVVATGVTHRRSVTGYRRCSCVVPGQSRHCLPRSPAGLLLIEVAHHCEALGGDARERLAQPGRVWVRRIGERRPVDLLTEVSLVAEEMLLDAVRVHADAVTGNRESQVDPRVAQVVAAAGAADLPVESDILSGVIPELYTHQVTADRAVPAAAVAPDTHHDTADAGVAEEGGTGVHVTRVHIKQLPLAFDVAHSLREPQRDRKRGVRAVRVAEVQLGTVAVPVEVHAGTRNDVRIAGERDTAVRSGSGRVREREPNRDIGVEQRGAAEPSCQVADKRVRSRHVRTAHCVPRRHVGKPAAGELQNSSF